MARIKAANNSIVLNKVVLATFFVYLFLFVYYYILNNNSRVGAWVQYSQLLLCFEFVVFFYPLSRIKSQYASLIICFLVLFNTFAIRSLFLDNHLTAFGPDPIDAYHYLDDARQTARLSLVNTFNFFSNQRHINYEFAIDDYGMSLIARYGYILGGSDKGYMSVMLIFNAISISVSTFVFAKLLRLMFHNQAARTGSVLFGLFSCFQMLAVYGLKENFFILFTITALYYSLKYISTFSFKNLTLSLLFILSLCLFRFAVSAQVLIALICTVILKRSNHKGLILFLFLLGGIVLLVALDVVIRLLGGSGLENMLIMAELRNTAKGGSMVVEYISQFIFSFIGTPTLFVGDFDFYHIPLFSCLLRNVIAVFFVFGSFITLKSFDEKSCFMLIYWILGSFMLIMAIRSSDFRYSSLYFPAFLALVIKGCEEREKVPFKYLISFAVLGVVFLFIRGWNG